MLYITTQTKLCLGFAFSRDPSVYSRVFSNAYRQPDWSNIFTQQLAPYLGKTTPRSSEPTDV